MILERQFKNSSCMEAVPSPVCSARSDGRPRLAEADSEGDLGAQGRLVDERIAVAPLVTMSVLRSRSYSEDLAGPMADIGKHLHVRDGHGGATTPTPESAK